MILETLKCLVSRDKLGNAEKLGLCSYMSSTNMSGEEAMWPSGGRGDMLSQVLPHPFVSLVYSHTGNPGKGNED